MHIRFISTGGTIDKIYFDAKSDYQVGEPVIGELLKKMAVGFPFTVESAMRKDSLDMDDADRALIRRLAEQCDEEHVLVTHGTDGMVATAMALLGIPGKRIVLTGALIPYAFGSSDGLFNLGAALAFAQSLPAGVYVAMNGRVFDWHNVRKNRDIGEFEELT